MQNRDPNAPTVMEYHEKTRLRTAALHAKRRYPGPAGAVLAAKITAWCEFGWRFGGGSAMADLVDELLKPVRAETPGEVSTPA